MKLTQQQRIPLSPQDTWLALHDVNVLQACIPGCDAFRAVSTDEFDVRITVRTGIVDLGFQGRIRLCDVDPHRSYTLRFEDSAGQSRAEARVRLEPLGQNETLLHYTASIGLGGAIANFGMPLWERIARHLAGEFFQAFEARVGRTPTTLT